MSRIETQSARLARLGFVDVARAARLIASWDRPESDPATGAVVSRLASSADPDLALTGFDRLVRQRPGLVEECQGDPAFAQRLVGVLGASATLGQELARSEAALASLHREAQLRDAVGLRSQLLLAIGADPADPDPVADPERADDLRRAYRLTLLGIVVRDLTAPDPLAILPGIAAELADLADATVEAALALARGEVPDWRSCRLGVVALGKTGAWELNYVSDVDVLFVAEPAPDDSGPPTTDPGQELAVATRLAAAVSRICSAHTGAGTIWQLDAALRPEGKAGPLVRTLASYASYYAKWAQNWEFQAMLKARPMAGDLALADGFVDQIWPLVWQVADNPDFVAQTQAMRRRVVELLPTDQVATEIKLSAGGLRDVEFSVQLLQLVHGRSDERLRLRGTFEALDELVAHGYIGRSDGAELEAAYRFQRLAEHRIQLQRLRRTHLMPSEPGEQRWLARSLGFAGPTELLNAWRASTRQVLGLHRRLFYSPVLDAVARIPSDQVRLTSAAAETRLGALGYGDPAAALRHIEALTAGLTRQAEIQRQLLPAMLGWFSAGPNPDHGLLAFRQVSEALGRTPWYLRTLRDGDAMAEHLARILASSRYAVDLLLRAPQSAALLADPAGLAPRPLAEIATAMRTAARRHETAETAIQAIRAVRRAELLRVAMADLLGELALDAVGEALSDLASATIEAALEVAGRGLEVPELTVLAMGRWGGRELSYGSDADAVFLTADTANPEAIRAATKVVTRLRSLLAGPGPDPALEIDIDLRPEGKGGPVIRTLESYIGYFGRWAQTWEAQALLRAHFGAGSRSLAERALEAIAQVRYPDGGLNPTQVLEIRKLKARMEVERIPRGVDPHGHVKLGPGGLSDVEWVAQLLQLNHATSHPALQTANTLGALQAAVGAGLLDPEDGADLTLAWQLASRIRNGIMLLRGRPGDRLPTDTRELAALAQVLGYAKGESSKLVEDYRRAARRARQVMDRVFWGND